MTAHNGLPAALFPIREPDRQIPAVPTLPQMPVEDSVPNVANPFDRWQSELKQSFRRSDHLAAYLKLDATSKTLAQSAFPLFVTRSFADRMVPGDWNDPLLRQVWIDPRESEMADGFVADPVGDLDCEVVPGLLHKYHGRVLFITTGACAIHCRYCFRRHFPYSSVPKSMDDWRPAIDYIRSDPSIEEVILSGGDPLTVHDGMLGSLVSELDSIQHLSRIRIHTRLPVVLPQRVNDSLLDWLSASRLRKSIVLHCNHANEINDEVRSAVCRLKQTDALMLNQTVLLRNVNDSAIVLTDLSRSLIDMNILPYYIHQLDPVAGAAHFHVPIEQGHELIEMMKASLPGYAIPKFVAEYAGEPNKTWL